MFCIEPKLFSWEIAVLWNVIFALTNGYLASVAICLAPQCPNIPITQRGQAGDIIVFSLTFGLVCGATLGFAVKDLIQMDL